MPTRPIAILGAGGHAKEVAWLIERVASQSGVNWKVAWFVDKAPAPGSSLLGHPVIDEAALAPLGAVSLAAGLGMSALRRRVVERIVQAAPSCTWPTFVDPEATIGPGVTLGEGSLIFARSILTIDIVVGKHVHVNRSAMLSHDTRIGDYSSICPAAVLSGNVTLGDEVFIGANATLIDGVSIAPRTLVGAHSCVVSDVTEEGTYVGVPARRVH